MLVGNYRIKLKNNKIKIPNKMLQELGNNIHIGINDENNIYIIDDRKLDEFSKHTDLLSFKILLSETIDESGSIYIPKDFLQHAYIEDECIIIGVCEHAELWNPMLWKKFTDDFEAHRDEYLKVLNQLVL